MTETHYIKILLKYKKTIIYIILIFIACLIPSSPEHKPKILIPNFDKIVHFTMFFGLSVVYSIENIRKKKLFNILIISILTALSTEISQKLFTTTRTFDVLDIAADLTGAIIGYLCFIWLYKLIMKNDD